MHFLYLDFPVKSVNDSQFATVRNSKSELRGRITEANGTFNGTSNGTYNGPFCGTFFSEPFHVIFDHKIGPNYWNTQLEEFGLCWKCYFHISEEVAPEICQTVRCVLWDIWVQVCGPKSCVV